MSHVLTEISGATDSSKALLFVRGFQGRNNYFGLPTHQTRWYRSLRSWGYTGRIFTFRWFSPASDCWSHVEKRYAPWRRNLLFPDASWRVEEAADALCDLFSRSDDIDPARTSVVGFSMGGWIIARALRIARRHGIQVRRAYLFGAAAPRASRWPELFDAVSDRLWNFHSEDDDVLQDFCGDSVGIYGLPCYHSKARDVNCTTLIDSHDEWPDYIHECLGRARLTPKHL